MTGVGLGRVRRMLLLVGVACVVLPVGSALAGTTVGLTGTPMSGTGWTAGGENIQLSYAMPAAGIVTSFQTQSGSCPFFTGGFNFQVLHPLGGNQYKVLGDTGDQSNPCDGNVHSFAPVGGPVAVQAGDGWGHTYGNGWVRASTNTGGSRVTDQMSEPAVGDTITVSSTSGGEMDESANLVVAPSIAKAFGAATVPVNGTTTLISRSLTRPRTRRRYLAWAFTDALPYRVGGRDPERAEQQLRWNGDGYGRVGLRLADRRVDRG